VIREDETIVADAKTTNPAEVDSATTNSRKWEAPPQRVRTSDSTDYDLGWTNQHDSRPAVPDELNPVTFSKDELPDPAVMQEQGVNLQSYLAHFGNVEGATVKEGVLVDEDSDQPLAEALTDGAVAGQPTGAVNPQKTATLEAPGDDSRVAPADVDTLADAKAPAKKTAAAKKS
jgi:hypothetical protein